MASRPYEAAGFSGTPSRGASPPPRPEEAPDFSPSMPVHHGHYWRPSTVANANRVDRWWDPRQERSLKGE